MKKSLLYLLLSCLSFVACKNNQANSSDATTDTSTEQTVNQVEQHTTEISKNLPPIQKQMKAAVDSMEANQKPELVITEGVDKLCDCYSKMGAFSVEIIKNNIPLDHSKALALKQQFANLATLSNNCQTNLYNVKLLNKPTFIEARKKCKMTFDNIKTAGVIIGSIK